MSIPLLILSVIGLGTSCLSIGWVIRSNLPPKDMSPGVIDFAAYKRRKQLSLKPISKKNRHFFKKDV